LIQVLTRRFCVALAEHFFTYRLYSAGRVVRIGKGGVLRRTDDAVEGYLCNAYGFRGWDSFEHQWHATESAAFKGEVRKIDSHESRTGRLPPWNSRRGGGGGQSYVSCKALLARGEPCRSLALKGNYGYCGIHR
jgi:hypothetical protein